MDRGDLVAGVFVGFCFAGAAAGAAGAIYLVWGPLDLPTGRYPIILILALYLLPPAIGAVAGFFGTMGVGYLILTPLADRRQAAEKRRKEAEAAEERSKKQAPLRRAIVEGDLKAVEAALKQNQQLDLTPLDSNGNYALHLASMNGHAAIVDALIAQKTPWQKRNNDGKMFYDVAPPDKVAAVLNAFYRSYARRLAKVFGEAGKEPILEQWLRHWLATQFDEAVTHTTLTRLRIGQGLAELAAVAAAKGDAAAAITALDAAIAFDAKNAEARFVRAQLELDTGDPQGALREAEAGLSASPKSAAGHAVRAMALAKLKRNNEAMTAYQKAIELDPNNDVYQQRLNELIMS